MEKSTKIMVMGGVLAIGLASASAQAAGTIACSVGANSPVVGAAGSFIKSDFTPQCSNAVSVSFFQDSVAIGVHSGSAKGAHTFGGTSNGGGVIQCESSSLGAPATAAESTSTVQGC